MKPTNMKYIKKKFLFLRIMRPFLIFDIEKTARSAVFLENLFPLLKPKFVVSP